jgi:hypothetical protein
MNVKGFYIIDGGLVQASMAERRDRAPACKREEAADGQHHRAAAGDRVRGRPRGDGKGGPADKREGRRALEWRARCRALPRATKVSGATPAVGLQG